MWGGANDINKKETDIKLKQIRSFALNLKHTNIIDTMYMNHLESTRKSKHLIGN
jgi:hypothetical protein